jgi:hypothetical protein
MVKSENSNNILDNMDKQDEKSVLSCIIPAVDISGSGELFVYIWFDKEESEEARCAGYSPKLVYDDTTDTHGTCFSFTLEECIQLFVDGFNDSQATHYLQQLKQVHHDVPYKNFNAPYPVCDNPIVLASILEKEAAKIRQDVAKYLNSEYKVDEETLEVTIVEPKVKH